MANRRDRVNGKDKDRACVSLRGKLHVRYNRIDWLRRNTSLTVADSRCYKFIRHVADKSDNLPSYSPPDLTIAAEAIRSKFGLTFVRRDCNAEPLNVESIHRKTWRCRCHTRKKKATRCDCLVHSCHDKINNLQLFSKKRRMAKIISKLLFFLIFNTTTIGR